MSFSRNGGGNQSHPQRYSLTQGNDNAAQEGLIIDLGTDEHPATTRSSHLPPPPYQRSSHAGSVRATDVGVIQELMANAALSSGPSATTTPSNLSLLAPRQSAPSTATDYASVSGKSSAQRKKLTSFFVRPGYGERGRKVSILANFYAVRASEGRGKIIHHYDVEIDPVVKVVNQKKPKALLRAVWEQLVLDQSGHREWGPSFANSAYDGRKNAFTPIKFDVAEGETASWITVVAPDGVVQKPSKNTDSSSDDEHRRFKVVIKHVALIDLEAVMSYCRTNKPTPGIEEECLTGLMATHILLRDVPSKTYAQVGAAGNRFFTSEGARPIPQGGMVCRGFMQSFKISSSGMPLLNLDMGFSAFIQPGPALEIIGKIIGKIIGQGRRGQDQRPHEVRELSPRDIAIVKNKIRGAKFMVTHRQSTRLHTVLSMTQAPARGMNFMIQGKDGAQDRNVSIPEYYKEYYGVTVTKPDLPCIQYGKKAFIPLEFVKFAEWNPLPPTKLSADQTGDMMKIAAMRPRERAAGIEEWRGKLGYEKQDKVKAWGLQVNTKMLKVDARILPPPQVLYRGGRSVPVRDGGWAVRDQQFYTNGPKPLKAWAFVSFDRYSDADVMQRYVDFLVRTLQRLGVVVENTRPPCIAPQDPRQDGMIEYQLKTAAQQAYKAGQCDPQLICVILPGKDAWLYERIKKVSMTELKKPVPTQCMQAAKIRKPDSIDAYTGNLVLKIQSKLGGVTHHVPISDLPGTVRGQTMLLGADLSHPPIRAGYEMAPTVACSVATYDSDCSKYSAQIRLQHGRDEVVKDFSSMITAHLKAFYAHNDHFPERILIFQDGVSEGQYAATLTYVHGAVLNACAALQPGYRPRILLCICAKRHSTRFFGRDADVDRSGNLPPGLVVDKSVTHPYAFDFFLQAHSGRLGTARPTHYICLLDELAITPDQLQQMIHSLCHAFPRCTRSVSLVPVCYFAGESDHLVCQKARIMIHESSNNTTYAPSESSAGRTSRDSKNTALSNIDAMQLQNVLLKNKELEEVMWWM